MSKERARETAQACFHQVALEFADKHPELFLSGVLTITVSLGSPDSPDSAVKPRPFNFSISQ